MRGCFEVLKQKLPGTFRVYSAEALLGAIVARQERFAERETLLLAGYAGMKKKAAGCFGTSAC